jgi:UDP-N-acetylmuramoylalanine--D-glutamate ligase
VVVAGNIGRPFIDALCEITPKTVVVLEVSSYQLEHVETFKPHIGVFTRFAPHHLDRHGSPESYFELKCRLFAQQDEGDFAVVHREVAVKLPGWVRSRVLSFSADDPEVLGLPLPPHQRENVAAALKVARLIDPDASLKGVDLKRALHLPHRLEPVAEIDGVRFYNDSKATSPEATRAALRALAGEPLVLIAGGYDEGVDPQLLARAIQDHAEDVRAIVLLGQTQEKWAQALLRVGFARVQTAQSLRQALSEALKLHPQVCLFSPAAPSFDRYPSYEERGERFRQAVLSLRP